MDQYYPKGFWLAHIIVAKASSLNNFIKDFKVKKFKIWT